MTEQPMTWRERLLKRASDSSEIIQAVSDEEVLTGPAWDEFQRRQEFEYMARFEPNAALREEVVLRLTGTDAQKGSVGDDWDKLLKAFRNALKVFSPGPIDLRTSGISPGSTRIHFVDGDATTSDGDLDNAAVGRVHQTRLADAAGELFRVIDATEGHKQLTEWADRMESFEKFANELSEHHLEAEFRHFGSSGRAKGATLSRAGMDYLESLLETRDDHVVESVQGRITELVLSSGEEFSGSVKVKAGTSKTASVRIVDFPLSKRSKLANYRLGQNVHFRVLHVFSVDGIGRRETVQYVFEEDRREETLPLGS